MTVVVGQVYLVDTTVLYGQDPKPYRPVVVVRVPDPAIDAGDTRVWVISRTTDLSREGVRHPANLALGLDLPGVFADEFLRWAELDDLQEPGYARLLGSLDHRTFTRVLSRYQNSGAG